MRTLRKSVRFELCFREGVGDHHGRCRPVEPAQDAVDELFRHEGKARMHIFREARVDDVGEGQSARAADGPRAQPDRAFRCDVNRIGRKFVDHPFRDFDAETLPA